MTITIHGHMGKYACVIIHATHSIIQPINSKVNKVRLRIFITVLVNALNKLFVFKDTHSLE